MERKILNRKKGRKGSDVRIRATVKITVTNRGRHHRTVRLEEPFPSSQDDRIKVKLRDIEPDDFQRDDDGKAVWVLSLEPGASQVISYDYEVRFPDGMKVRGL